QRFARDDPWRDGAGEILGQEGAERLVFPGLQVARRPIVEQAQPEQVVVGPFQRDAFAGRIALAYENAEFQFVVQPRAGPETGRLACAGRAGLADRPREGLARYTDAGGPAVVADR